MTVRQLAGFTVIQAMQDHGGNFTRALAAAWRAADDANRTRIQEAFPELFQRYERLAEKLTRMEG